MGRIHIAAWLLLRARLGARVGFQVRWRRGRERQWRRLKARQADGVILIIDLPAGQDDPALGRVAELYPIGALELAREVSSKQQRLGVDIGGADLRGEIGRAHV